jgi:hypothetical protein
VVVHVVVAKVAKALFLSLSKNRPRDPRSILVRYSLYFEFASRVAPCFLTSDYLVA